MLGHLLDGRYKIIRVLGAGGFGQTYIAEDTKLYNNTCVVKQLKPMATDSATLQIARRLFESEAQLLHKLGTHDQIPQLLAHFEENSEFFLVQQFIDGHPVSDELIPGTKINETEVISLLENILQPLAFVHQNNVIHRDIKPPNLIRRHSDNKVVLIDFGAVKQIGTQVVNGQGVTKMTVGIGTAGYMPSEQSRGSPRLSSDVYAVGMIGIQALTGLMPHQFQEDVETAEIVWRNLTQVSETLGNTLDRMVRYDFRQRYQSAMEALAAVQQLNNAYAPTLPSTSPAFPPTLAATPPVDNSPHLHSPPPTVPPQYRQEFPQPIDVTPPSPPALAKRPKAGMAFYFQWVLVNVVGLIGGTIVAAIANMLIASNFVIAATIGATMGFMQLLVLRRQIPISEKLWVAGTTLGTCLALIFSGSNPDSSLIWVGILVGIIQWWLLRKQVKQAGWWILVNALGGWFGGIVSGAVLVWLLRSSQNLESRNT
jgi:serine/threonine-protein kinase